MTSQWNVPVALSIAGSDPSGGAGIQADLATFATCKVFGMAVITALTAQNAEHVTDMTAVAPSMVTAQITTLLEGMRPLAIKTGMIVNADIIRSIIDALPSEIPLIVDPVMIASSGYRLLDESAIKTLKEELIPRATVITPNIPEAEALTGSVIQTEEDMETAGRIVLKMGARVVVIKGGHASGEESVDLLITPQRVQRMCSVRMPYQVHGSGCCFSAAITAYIALGLPIDEACRKGKEIVNTAIRMAIKGKSGFRIVNPSFILGRN